MPKTKRQRPQKRTIRPPDRLNIAWGIYQAPRTEIEDAEAAGFDLRPWVAQAHTGLALTAARSGFHLLNTYWGTDEESVEQAITVALLQETFYPETCAIFAMGVPTDRLAALGQQDNARHLAIANVPIDGKPPISFAALRDLPRVGW